MERGRSSGESMTPSKLDHLNSSPTRACRKKKRKCSSNDEALLLTPRTESTVLKERQLCATVTNEPTEVSYDVKKGSIWDSREALGIKTTEPGNVWQNYGNKPAALGLGMQHNDRRSTKSVAGTRFSTFGEMATLPGENEMFQVSSDVLSVEDVMPRSSCESKHGLSICGEEWLRTDFYTSVATGRPSKSCYRGHETVSGKLTRFPALEEAGKLTRFPALEEAGMNLSACECGEFSHVLAKQWSSVILEELIQRRDQFAVMENRDEEPAVFPSRS